MPDSIGSLMRRAAAAACLVLLAAPCAVAQLAPVNAPATPQFMPRYDFHLSAAALGSGDERFSWDIHFGGDFDFVDYVRGRLTFLADYQAVLGSQLRAFDPNQGNYNLGASSSFRIRGTELAGGIHHVSRHLSDRPKQIAIAWNDLYAELVRRFATNGTTLDVRVRAGKIIAHAFVDYSWLLNADMTVRRQMTPHTGVFGRAFGDVYGIDSALSRRDRQKGGRLEGGARLSGTSGALELFGGFERVVDADAFEQRRRAWPFLGFRLVR